MTKEQFIAKAVRAQEWLENLPRGWWGTRTDVRSPKGMRVRWNGSLWIVSGRALPTEKHASRQSAMRAAQKRERS